MMYGIKQANITSSVADVEKYPIIGTSYKGKSVNAIRHSVYGICSQPPVGSMGVLLKVESMSGLHYGIFDYAVGRFKNLQAGEVQVGNYISSASIKFDKDGNITITAPGKITCEVGGDMTANVAGNLTADITGQTTITTNQFSLFAATGSIMAGNITINGTVTADDFIVDSTGVNLASHVHTGDSGGNTGAPKN